jgi:PhoH-like ATPase
MMMRRMFVLDTNVLMHDPSSIFRFKEHDIFIPMVVLEELDNSKKGLSEVARNVRQTNRYFAELLEKNSPGDIIQGLPIASLLTSASESLAPQGKIFFQATPLQNNSPVQTLPGSKNDNTILATAAALQHTLPHSQITLVSKDINLRIKAAILNINAEDYYNDKVIDDVQLMHKGFHQLPANFWDTHGKSIEAWQEAGRTFYRISGPLISDFQPNDFIYIENSETFTAIVREANPDHIIAEIARDYRTHNHGVWGINARNQEQNYALNLLMDPEIDFVTLQGIAGSGKTLLTLAAGLAQTLDKKIYQEIIVTRVTVPVGEDIGFLPGTEEEKMTPWMGALLDNLEVLHCHEMGEDWQRQATSDLLHNRIKIRSLNFMRGRTFLNRFLIIDEAQNLTSKQIKTLITRAGPGTKIVCLGDIAQIDTPYLTESTSGLTYAIDRFRSWTHSGHVTLTRGERSRLAEYAAGNL